MSRLPFALADACAYVERSLHVQPRTHRAHPLGEGGSGKRAANGLIICSALLCMFQTGRGEASCMKRCFAGYIRRRDDVSIFLVMFLEGRVQSRFPHRGSTQLSSFYLLCQVWSHLLDLRNVYVFRYVLSIIRSRLLQRFSRGESTRNVYTSTCVVLVFLSLQDTMSCCVVRFM